VEGALEPRRAPGPVARNDQRRARIIAALRECMLARGYAATSLSDIARSAGMTPSHLLYYFKGKDAILNAYWETTAAGLLERLRAIEPEPIERRLELLADAFFSGVIGTQADIGIVLEFFGLAVHDKDLYRTKARFDREIKVWLARLIAQSPRPLGALVDAAAEAVYALLMGLCTAAYFDERLGSPQARAIFLMSLRQIAGFDPPLSMRA
jgi:AcrR family transcriptional regulator